jgi:hypothetical protein
VLALPSGIVGAFTRAVAKLREKRNQKTEETVT